MDKHEFENIKKRLRLTNQGVSDTMGVRLLTVTNWADGRWGIPLMAEKFLHILLSMKSDQASKEDRLAAGYTMGYEDGHNIGHAEGMQEERKKNHYRTGYGDGHRIGQETSRFTGGYKCGYEEGLREGHNAAIRD